MGFISLIKAAWHDSTILRTFPSFLFSLFVIFSPPSFVFHLSTSPPLHLFDLPPPSVKVLSEFASSCRVLCGAVLVNPWNMTDIARATAEALAMKKAERRERAMKDESYVELNGVLDWSKRVLCDVRSARKPDNFVMMGSVKEIR